MFKREVSDTCFVWCRDLCCKALLPMSTTGQEFNSQCATVPSDAFEALMLLSGSICGSFNLKYCVSSCIPSAELMNVSGLLPDETILVYFISKHLFMSLFRTVHLVFLSVSLNPPWKYLIPSFGLTAHSSKQLLLDGIDLIIENIHMNFSLAALPLHCNSFQVGADFFQWQYLEKHVQFHT